MAGKPQLETVPGLGARLRRLMQGRFATVSFLAERTGLSRQTIYRVLNSDEITPASAARLAVALGVDERELRQLSESASSPEGPRDDAEPYITRRGNVVPAAVPRVMKEVGEALFRDLERQHAEGALPARLDIALRDYALTMDVLAFVGSRLTDAGMELPESAAEEFFRGIAADLGQSLARQQRRDEVIARARADLAAADAADAARAAGSAPPGAEAATHEPAPSARPRPEPEYPPVEDHAVTPEELLAETRAQRGGSRRRAG